MVQRVAVEELEKNIQKRLKAEFDAPASESDLSYMFPTGGTMN